MAKVQFTVCGMMIAVSLVAVVLFADIITGSARGDGTFDMRVNVFSWSGRQPIGVAWVRVDGPAVDPKELGLIGFRDADLDDEGMPIVPVSFSFQRNGVILPKTYRQETGYRMLRIDFADGSWDYATVKIPDLIHHPRRLRAWTVFVE